MSRAELGTTVAALEVMTEIAVELLARVTGGADEGDKCGHHAAEANSHKQAWTTASQTTGGEHAANEAYQRYLQANEAHRRCMSG